jgi:hypothetical protein
MKSHRTIGAGAPRWANRWLALWSSPGPSRTPSGSPAMILAMMPSASAQPSGTPSVTPWSKAVMKARPWSPGGVRSGRVVRGAAGSRSRVGPSHEWAPRRRPERPVRACTYRSNGFTGGCYATRPAPVNRLPSSHATAAAVAARRTSPATVPLHARRHASPPPAAFSATARGGTTSPPCTSPRPVMSSGVETSPRRDRVGRRSGPAVTCRRTISCHRHRVPSVRGLSARRRLPRTTRLRVSTPFVADRGAAFRTRPHRPR